VSSRKVIIYLGLTFIFLRCGLAIGQVSQILPLDIVLMQLESRYDCTFNYVEDIVKDVQISMPNSTMSLPEVVAYLQRETGLQVQLRTDNFITLSKPNGVFICGFLKDKNTLTALEDATIQTQGASAVTDANGYFEIKVPSNEAFISIRYLGYSSIERLAKYFKLNDCGSIFMRPQT